MRAGWYLFALATLVGVVALIAACGGGDDDDDDEGESTPTAAARAGGGVGTSMPTLTPTPSKTETTTPTATSTPTPTATPTQTPTPAPGAAVMVEGWEDAEVSVICLAIAERYPQTGDGFSGPVMEMARGLLSELKFSLTDQGGECDATLTVDVTGTALGDSYQESGFLFTGASYEGTLALSGDGRPEVTRAVGATLSPPFSAFFLRPPTEPQDAPFDAVSAGLLTDGLAQLWGVDAYVAALRTFRAPDLLRNVVETIDGAIQTGALSSGDAGVVVSEVRTALDRAVTDSDLARAAAAFFEAFMESGLGTAGSEAVAIEGLTKLLQSYDDTVGLFGIIEVIGDLGTAGSIGDQHQDPIVVRLIELLDHEFPDLGVAAADALRRITGNDFGVDAERWRAWWEGE